MNQAHDAPPHGQKVFSLAPDPVLQHAAPRYGIVKVEVLSASSLPSPVGGSPILLLYILKNENFR
jgi:hypothetical protein